MSFTVEPRTDLIWAAIDLDGTLAEHVWPDPGIGEPIWENVAKLRVLMRYGYTIVIHTSRGWEAYEQIEAWLLAYGIHADKIICGKLLAKIYVDDKAVHESEESWLPS